MVPGVKGEDIVDKAKPWMSETLHSAALGCWRAHANVWKVYGHPLIVLIARKLSMKDGRRRLFSKVHNVFVRLS